MALDYRDIAAQLYPISVITMKKLSTLVADALNSLVKGGVDPEKIHVIGYSLGAQIAGRIGRQTIFRISRITGDEHFISSLDRESKTYRNGIS